MTEGNHYNPGARWADRAKNENDEALEEAVFFTLQRQSGSPVELVTFALKEGYHHSIASNEIEEIFFHPERGIFLFFAFGKVQIEGRNLQKLYRHLRERKVTEIREFSDNAQQFFDKEALFISRIHYESENLKKLRMRQEA